MLDPQLNKCLNPLATVHFLKENAKQATAKYDSLTAIKAALNITIPGADKNA